MSKQQPSKEERLSDQKELNAQQASAQVAAQEAARQGQQGQNRLLEQVSNPDIFNGSDEALEEQLGIDFARPHILSQKEEEDVWRHRWLNENEADRIIHEQNPGRLCFGPFLALAQGVHDRDTHPNERLTDVGKRKTREALNAKTAFQTMGKNGRTWKGISEIISTNKVERDGDESDSTGRLGKVRQKLFG